MTASIWRGQIIVGASLVVLVAFCFAMYYGGYHLGLLVDTSTRAKDALMFLFAAPLFALGGWWIYPRSKGWILAAYGVLVMLFAYSSVVFLFVPSMLPIAPADNIVADGFVLMGLMFGIATMFFAGIVCVLVFSASVRDFGNYRRGLHQETLRKTQGENG
jgi:hypothetical protein